MPLAAASYAKLHPSALAAAAELQVAQREQNGIAAIEPLKTEANMSIEQNNPKLDVPGSAAKDPDEWVSGDDPMTASQASYLKTLAEQADDSDAYADHLSKAEASKRIDELRERLNLPERP